MPKLDHAEVETMLQQVPHLPNLTCEELYDEEAEDLDILANLSDFPPKQRAAIRASVLRNLAAIRAQLKSKHCKPA